jgi:two-component system CheB/CheR fusion protein
MARDGKGMMAKKSNNEDELPEGSTTDGDGLEELLEFIRESRGFDFTGYKRTSLTRRINKRMTEVGVSDYFDYKDLLETTTEEFTALFNTILINVTSFFRDTEAWEFLQRDVIPTVLAEAEPDEEIRIWSAGCSSGEEAYSMAILFAEVLGLDEAVRRVKIYGTDVDEDALHTARVGVYPERSLETLPTELRQKYFESVASGYAFRTDLRRRVIFGRHDVTGDAPISRLHLLVCRNTLMYFNVETQSQIIDRFDFALRETGYLFLGKAEILLADSALRNRQHATPDLPAPPWRRRSIDPTGADAIRVHSWWCGARGRDTPRGARPGGRARSLSDAVPRHEWPAGRGQQPGAGHVRVDRQ